MDILIKGMDEIPEDGAVLVVKHDNGKAYIKHACTYGYSMELVKLPAVQPDHVADVSKKASISCSQENDLISRKAAIEAIEKIAVNERDTDRGFLIFCGLSAAITVIDDLPSAQPETAKRIVGKSRDGMTLWYQCDMCNEPVHEKDEFCPGCGRRLTDG